MELDLDVKREERAKTRAESGWSPPTLRFGGEMFVLPDEMPADVGFKLGEGDTRGAFRVLLGDRFDTFWSLRPSNRDLIDAVSWAVDAYTAASNGNGAGDGNKPAKRPAEQKG